MLLYASKPIHFKSKSTFRHLALRKSQQDCPAACWEVMFYFCDFDAGAPSLPFTVYVF